MSELASKPSSAAPGEQAVLRSSMVLAVSSGLVGVLSYTCGLLMANLLQVKAYSDYSAAQALLTTVGVAASALVPLPLSREIRANPRGSAGRKSAVGFALTVSLGVGLAAMVVLTGIAWLFTNPAAAITVGLAGFSLFAIMPVWGWLQGESRFTAYAGMSVAEVALRLVVSTVAVRAGLGTAGGVAGFIAGAALVLVAGIWWLRRDLGARLGAPADRSRWTETVRIGLVQLVVSTVVGVDVVLVAVLGADSVSDASYQAIATLAKGPVYVATGVTVVSFPLLRTVSADRLHGAVASMARSFAWLALPAAAVLATVPSSLVALVLPARYLGSLHLLPWLALTGLGYGTVGMLAILLLALGRYRRCVAGLAVTVVVLLSCMVGGWALGGATGLAIAAALGSVLVSGVLAVLAANLLPPGSILATLRAVLSAGALLLVLWLVHEVPLLWVPVVLVAGAFVLVAAKRGKPKEPEPIKGLRVLHLGFEDPAMPGSGGGSLRTHEINRRLAAQGHEVTVLTTRFPGCQDRVQDGVRYCHVGFGKGGNRATRTLGYVLGLPFAVRRHRGDLVVEDFFAPISSMAAPLWTGRPTVGVVQWLNAAEKSREYHLPFTPVERFGVRRHHSVVAVSEGVAERLRGYNERISVTVIGNGVDPLAFSPSARLGEDVVFIGRLEIAQKGLDLLFTAWKSVSEQVRGTLVVAGTGPDEGRLRQLAEELGIADRVRFAGWVSGRDKYELLASARLAVVPSRFETFGIVAVEALASGTPVVAFDIPCLREVIPAECGQLVEAFDVAAFARVVAERYQDEAWLAGAGRLGRQAARAWDWDLLAERQAEFYRAAVVSGPPTVHAQLSDLGRERTRGRRRRRLAVVGNVGNGNTGDESLLAVTLSELDGDAEVTVISRNPAAVTAVHGVPAVPMTVAGALPALLRCDGLVIVGGGMFGPGLPRLVRLLPHVAEWVGRLGRDVAYVAIGVYAGMPPGTLAALRRAARRGRLTVRDELSLHTLDIGRPVPCVGDLAWQLPSAEPALARAELARAGVDLDRPLLVLSPKAGTNSEQNESVVDTMALAARQWVDRGGSVVAIALSDHADYGRDSAYGDTSAAGLVSELAGVPVPVVGPNLAPALAKAVIGQAHGVLGLRFHALVFALATGTACIGFPWEPKAQALLAEHGLPTLTDQAALLTWLDDLLPTTTLARR
ncbi:glycosyltransferase [Kutzneria albida]|uniref:Polysaccharide pyruvyl transferase domain-containing protein n=1 Tax=Kutzneria albida DSM 43870 TaxID=1449976 RepID=W5WGP8_9PSEU|nr:glycosyltransferase [Kutzneria albida]AHI00374.1 hypothetical protein KALB_7016 [Kutzneria albida DSM 43870]